MDISRIRIGGFLRPDLWFFILWEVLDCLYLERLFLDFREVSVLGVEIPGCRSSGVGSGHLQASRALQKVLCVILYSCVCPFRRCWSIIVEENKNEAVHTDKHWRSQESLTHSLPLQWNDVHSCSFWNLTTW